MSVELVALKEDLARQMRNAMDAGLTASYMLGVQDGKKIAAAPATEQAQEPVAHVPVHPRFGPLWSETFPHGSEVQPRATYPAMDLYAAPAAQEAHGPGTPAARFHHLMDELEKRVPDSKPFSASSPEGRYLAMLDAAIAKPLPVAVDPKSRVTTDWPYTRTFNAIAAAVKRENSAIDISVAAFVKAWDAGQPVQSPDERIKPLPTYGDLLFAADFDPEECVDGDGHGCWANEREMIRVDCGMPNPDPARWTHVVWFNSDRQRRG